MSIQAFALVALAISLALPASVHAVSASVEPGIPGSVLLKFDGSGGAPTVVVSPTLSCTAPARVSGAWRVECDPAVGSGARAAAAPPCRNLVGFAGGTPVTIGQAFVRVGCGSVSATCGATWVGQGQCTALLPGDYRYPLRCEGDATGTAIGGFFYAQCIVGV